jgi:pSer/pThr/pTyr-binding forkhead associated (FHA) protein
MAKLFFLLDGNSMGEFALDKERITIGRRPSNQIHIDNLAVSGEHAVIVTIGNDSFLEDLNSTNGTMVNGEAIKKHVLQHDDVIEFGKYQLRYVNEKQTGTNHNDGFEKTMMLMPSKQPKPVREKPVAEVVAIKQNSAANDIVNEEAVENGLSEPSLNEQDNSEKSALSNDASGEGKSETEQQITDNQMSDKTALDEPVVEKSAIENPITQPNPAFVPSIEIARLQVLNGASAGRELMLNKTMTTLGKPGSQVAVINKRPNGYFITHVGGNSLPMVNGQIIGLQAHALNNRDVIELAGTKMEFFQE